MFLFLRLQKNGRMLCWLDLSVKGTQLHVTLDESLDLEIMTDLWACLWGIVLIVNWHSLLQPASFSRKGPLSYLRPEKARRTWKSRQAGKQAAWVFSISLLLIVVQYEVLLNVPSERLKPGSVSQIRAVLL